MTKKKLIFFNYPLNTNKICSVVTTRPVNDLIKDEIIPKGSKYVVEDYVESNDLNYVARLAHVDKLVFDDYENPTKVVFDMDLLQFYALEMFKEMRTYCFEVLDNLQMRALIKNKIDVVSMIEDDKQKLRDIPQRISYAGCKTPVEVFSKLPIELTVNYKEKYESVI